MRKENAMMILERLADLSIISSMLILCILIARGIIRKFSYRVAKVIVFFMIMYFRC